MAIKTKPETGEDRVKEILEATKNFAKINSSNNSSVISYFESLKDFLSDQE